MTDLTPGDRALRALDMAKENIRALWSALSMIREAVEQLGPVGAMPSGEHVCCAFGPEPHNEAEAIIAGIQTALLSAEADGRRKGTPSERAYHNALLWAFDRLTIDGGMNARMQAYTAREIGKVLCGQPSAVATYTPDEWTDAGRLEGQRRAPLTPATPTKGE